MSVARLRVFAGPNGSGKSTIKTVVAPSLLGQYLNPDELEKEVKEKGYLDARDMAVQTTTDELVTFFLQHPLINRTEYGDLATAIKWIDKGFISFEQVGFDSYMSAILVDFFRHKYLNARQSFTFETVMSSPDKIELLKKAQANGYRTYLYYVATEDPAINLQRINHRVKTGGHSVPAEKVVSRYYRSLELLFQAIQYTNRAFVFDNSDIRQTWIAEITNGSDIEVKTDNVPAWFKRYVLAKIE